ncbi:protein MTSS 1 [Bombina bombina]|uniref:protein MTSS 1 n=1 Tax=Bombina bombina TaxID=8345 RepID=UPI00235AC767|nr:protein MTSS 1 [Bombina bombina]
MDAGMEKECSALGGLFQTIMNDMKSSYPTWEDFVNKAIKLQSQLKTTTVVTGSFLDAFQKIADMAINTRGATKEIGSALTRMCMRHRNIESRLKHLTIALTDSLINPLEIKIEEWKKIANQLDKDHAKGNNYLHGSIRHVPSMDSISSSVEALHIRSPSAVMFDAMFQDPKMNSLQQVSASVGASGENCTSKSDQAVDAAKSTGSIYVAKPKSARDHLALALHQGLSSEIQLSRDSLHCSSGYSTQTTTPSCSDDTLPSHALKKDPTLFVAEYDYISLHGEQEEPEQLDFDKSSTIPRNSDISQNYRRMFQTKRPASTVSLLADPDPIVRSPYVATIKRKPSNKPTVRRGTISGVPIPIRPPMVPMKAVNISDIPKSPYGDWTNSDEFAHFKDARSDLFNLKPGLCTSAQSLNAMQTTYCAFIPKQSYSQSIHPPSSPRKMFATNANTVDTTVSQTAAPKVIQSKDSIENATNIIDSEQVPPQVDMLSMIKRGVKLRKTISNDRSAPQIK